jgi:hypothetical protein
MSRCHVVLAVIMVALLPAAVVRAQNSSSIVQVDHRVLIWTMPGWDLIDFLETTMQGYGESAASQLVVMCAADSTSPTLHGHRECVTNYSIHSNWYSASCTGTAFLMMQ